MPVAPILIVAIRYVLKRKEKMLSCAACRTALPLLHYDTILLARRAWQDQALRSGWRCVQP
jgi:hypothetical protein